MPPLDAVKLAPTPDHDIRVRGGRHYVADRSTWTRRLRVRVLPAVMLAIVSVCSSTAGAQELQGSTLGVDSRASTSTARFRSLDVTLDPFTLRLDKRASLKSGLAVSSDRFLAAPTSTRSGPRARSTTRIVAGAIVGAVGGFFAGGFLGAHIEGDRCNCDDPGVRGFLIGAPVGAVAGGIVAGRFLF